MKKNVVLGLFADRIDILLCAGDHVTAARRIPVDLSGDSAAWRQAVHRADQPLIAAIAEMKATGLAATVLYHSPTACCDFSSLSLRSAAQAAPAAILAATEALTCSMDDAVCAAAVIGKNDRSAAGEPQTHVAVAADHDDTVEQLADLVEKAGLKFVSATPIDATVMARLGARSLRSGAANAGFLYVGENRSFFVIADGGALLFARPINLGIESLATSMTRPVRGLNEVGPTELPLPEARGILHQFGFPQREQVVHAQRGLTGAQIIPLLQPILQRFIVELRQSLRFGVAEEQRQNVALTLTGPGCAIPNFAGLISAELGLSVTPDESHAAYDCREPDSCGSELMDALEVRKNLARLRLQPKRIACVRHMSRLRRCLITGAAAALGLIVMDMFQVEQRLDHTQRELATVQSQSGDLETFKSTGEKLFASITAMEKLEKLISTEIGEAINVRAAMLELSRLTPETAEDNGGVRLTLIAFTQDKGKTVGRLSGYAFESVATPAAQNSGNRTQLEPFIERLKHSPLFEEIALARVQTSNIKQKSAQQFEVNLIAVPIPSLANKVNNRNSGGPGGPLGMTAEAAVGGFMP